MTYQNITEYPVAFPIRAGALVRKSIRRYLLRAQIAFTEDKSLIDSQFMVTIASGAPGRGLQAFLRSFND